MGEGILEFDLPADDGQEPITVTVAEEWRQAVAEARFEIQVFPPS